MLHPLGGTAHPLDGIGNCLVVILHPLDEAGDLLGRAAHRLDEPGNPSVQRTQGLGARQNGLYITSLTRTITPSETNVTLPRSIMTPFSQKTHAELLKDARTLYSGPLEDAEIADALVESFRTRFADQSAEYADKFAAAPHTKSPARTEARAGLGDNPGEVVRGDGGRVRGGGDSPASRRRLPGAAAPCG